MQACRWVATVRGGVRSHHGGRWSGHVAALARGAHISVLSRMLPKSSHTRHAHPHFHTPRPRRPCPAVLQDCRHPLLHPAELWVMAAGGNLATTTWALELGLVGPLELEGYDSDTRDSKGGSGSDGGGLLPLLGTGYKLELRIELNMHSLRVWVWRLVQQERAALQPGAAGAEEEGSAVAGSADGCEQGARAAAAKRAGKSPAGSSSSNGGRGRRGCRGTGGGGGGQDPRSSTSTGPNRLPVTHPLLSL